MIEWTEAKVSKADNYQWGYEMAVKGNEPCEAWLFDSSKEYKKFMKGYNKGKADLTVKSKAKVVSDPSDWLQTVEITLEHEPLRPLKVVEERHEINEQGFHVCHITFGEL